MVTGALALTAALFAGGSVAVLATFGVVGAFESALVGLVGAQLAADLGLALLALAVGMWQDGRRLGLPVGRYLLLTAVLGSVGPLVYLVHRRLAHPGASFLVTLPRWMGVLLAFVTVDFAVLTAWMVADVGVVGFVAAVTANAAAVLGFVDLCLALGLLLAWMIADAGQHRGRIGGASDRAPRLWPYVALTCCFGSLGWMAWLLRTRRASWVTPTPTGAAEARG